MGTLALVRGPVVKNEKSGSLEFSEMYNKKLADWRQSAIEKAVETLQSNPEFSNISRYISYIEGDQWPEERAVYRSRYRDNRIAKTRIESLAFLTDIRPTMEVYSKFNQTFKDQAKIIQNTIHYEWHRTRLDLRLADVIDHACFGTGYWKLGAWAPGYMTAAACGMDMVLPIQEGATLQESTSILFRCFKTPQYFKNRWPDRAQGIEEEASSTTAMNTQPNQYARPWGIDEYTWINMSPAMRYHLNKRNTPRATLTQSDPYPLIELQEFWVEDWSVNETGGDVLVKDPWLSLDAHNYWYIVKPGKRLYPRKRLIVFGGERVMYDGPSPYWHGLYPFAKLCLNPTVWTSGGLSKYRDLLPIQDAMNEIDAGVQDLVKRAVNPQLITKDGAVNTAAWDKFFPDLPGGKLRMNPIANPSTDLIYGPVPQIPAWVINQRQNLGTAFKEQSGAVDIAGMGKKKQVPAGDTLQQMQDAMQTPYRRESRMVEAFLEDSGLIAASNVIQFYTANQRMYILGPDGLTREDFDFHPGSLWAWGGPPQEYHKNFGISIAQGSLHGGSKDRDKNAAILLYRMNAISLHELYRKLDVANAEQIIGEIGQERQSGLGPAPAGKSHASSRGQKTGQAI